MREFFWPWFPLISQREAGFFRMMQEIPRRAQDGSAADHLPAALLTPTLLVVSTDGHRLQRRFNQAKSNTEVMEPVLQFLFHGAPFKVVQSDRNSIVASYR
jgi:hypothetical protein